MKTLSAGFETLRPAQWIKNLVVLAPLVFSRQLSDLRSVGLGLLGVLLFCMVSSAVYVFNDLRDLENDKLHPTKKSRPIASGRLSKHVAFALGLALALVALGIAALLPNVSLQFESSLGGYLVLNFFYILRLKRIVILDAMALSMGFVLRVLGGAAIIGVPASEWLLLCTLQLALFLAFSKRRHELVLLDTDAKQHREVLEHYSPHLLDQIIAVVTTSTLVCYLLYTIDPRTQEKFDGMHLIYTVPFVLYGIFRYLYLVHQRGEGGSPTRALLTDRPLLGNVLLWVLVTLAILYRKQLPFF